MGGCISASVCNSGGRTRRRRSLNGRSLEQCVAASSTSLNHAPTDVNNNSNNAFTTLVNTYSQQTPQANTSSNNFNNNSSSNNRSSRSNNRSFMFRSPSFSNTTSNNSTGSYLNAVSANYAFYVPPTGKTKRLKKDLHKHLKCDKRLSEMQLKAKRDEFWHTAPAFEGKPEIWSALQAAIDSIEVKNFELAQAIIDSANIIVPNGLLNDCYDELGNRYQIPVYVLVKPANLIKKQAKLATKNAAKDRNVANNVRNKSKKKSKRREESEDEDVENSQSDEDNCEDLDEDEDDDDDNDENDKEDKKFKKKSSNKRIPSTTVNGEGGRVVGSNSQSTEDPLIPIKFRVSSLNQQTNSDLRLCVSPAQTVASLKQKLKEATQIDTHMQRMYFGGKLMRDKERLRVHKLKKNVVIQVIIRPEKEVEKEEASTQRPKIGAT